MNIVIALIFAVVVVAAIVAIAVAAYRSNAEDLQTRADQIDPDAGSSLLHAFPPGSAGRMSAWNRAKQPSWDRAS